MTSPDKDADYTTDRYPDPNWDVLRPLQDLADAGVIKLLTVWCSEKGILPAGGHFCGADARHVPDTFGVVTDPPLASRLKRKQVPVTFEMTLRSEPEDG